MIKKLLVFSLLVCLLGSTALATSLHDNDSQRIEYRHSIMFARSEAHRIGMEVVLDYLGDDTTTELETSYDNFIAYYDDLDVAVEAVDFDALWDARLAMIDEAEDFRTNARELISNTTEVRTAITDALVLNEDYLATLEQDVYDKHVALLLAIFDTSVLVSQEAITELEAEGIDVTEVQAKLDEIEARRSTLEDKVEAAYDACIGDLILVCAEDEYTEYIEYRRETNEMFRELRRMIHRTRHTQWVEGARQRLADAEAKLLELDIDTTEYETAIDEITAKLDEAEDSLDEEDYETARSLMAEAKALFKSYLEQIRVELASSRSTERLTKVSESVSRADAKITEYEEKGADVTEHQVLLDEAKTSLSNAESDCESGDYVSCGEKLVAVNDKLKAILALPRPQLTAVSPRNISTKRLNSLVSLNKTKAVSPVLAVNNTDAAPTDEGNSTEVNA